ncbi:DNA primase [Fulvivirga lutea]|uniref:DNA primase n=1 Tax=Fulvivirga lutea TaxID=2810512 RepID=A0A974WK04_9BACT|nr:DNA primase [Fulvivirga lutea]QSE99218.1 DNA primase [Fulvivirga lutea]
MIAKQTIQEVQDRADIEDIVSDYVTLKRKGSGKYLWACCPFHDEKTPSFAVTPDRGIYKCFGCGKSGDSINFVMEHDGLNYVETIRHLAKKYGIEIIEDEQTDDQLAEQNEKDSLYIVLNYANEYFKKQLLETDEGKSIGLSYFKERGYDAPIIEKFQLGYSQSAWDSLLQDATKNAYNEDLLEKAGLIVRKEGDKKYDRFRGRVIFPIHNVTGKVVAFGARTLKKDDKPKYLNSPESDVYHKSKILYGLYQAKGAIRQQDNCYLVEGYTDVISLHQSDIENVVSSSGTSLTDEQIKLISRFSQNITVLFDGDAAGMKASLRGIDMILEAGMNVRVVVFPEGEDPDSYSKKLGTSEFKAFLKEHTTDFISFKTSLYAEESARDPLKKAESIKEIVSSIGKIPDGIKRAVYLKESSKLLDIDESVLVAELNKILIKDRRKDTKKREEEATGERLLDELITETEVKSIDVKDQIRIQERESIRLLVNYGLNEIEEEYKIYNYLLNELEDVEFVTPVYKEIFELFKERLDQGEVIDDQYLIANGSEAIKKEVIDLVTERREISPNWNDKYQIFIPAEHDLLETVVYTHVARLKFRVIQKLITENLAKMKVEKDSEEQDKLFIIHDRLKKSEMELAKVLGIVVSR